MSQMHKTTGVEYVFASWPTLKGTSISSQLRPPLIHRAVTTSLVGVLGIHEQLEQRERLRRLLLD